MPYYTQFFWSIDGSEAPDLSCQYFSRRLITVTELHASNSSTESKCRADSTILELNLAATRVAHVD